MYALKSVVIARQESFLKAATITGYGVELC
jgi:hypothetical protein